MNRTPIFVVSKHNPQTSLAKSYARVYSPTTDRWVCTSHPEYAKEFGYLFEAQAAYDKIVMECSNNKWWVIKIERIDLDDALLDDIDNLADM